MPCIMVQSHLRPVHRWLTYSSSNNSDTSDDTPPAPRATPTDSQVHLEEDEEEDFQMVLWMTNIGLLRKCLTEHYAYTKCLTAWTMTISMPLCELFTSFLC